MAILRWTPGPYGFRAPWRDLERLRNQMSGFLDSLAGTVETPRRPGVGVFPLLNLEEDADNLYLTAELPGLSGQDVDLSVEGDSLTLRGERKIQEIDEKVSYHRREREAGVFRRVIALPVKIDGDKVRAEMKNGVLEVTLPKAAEAKPKQIVVGS
jgi:HSP20 family protein